MLQRYLGNKTHLTPEILRATEQLVEPGATIGDLFSGSVSVSLELKKHGYNVVSNDINLFSHVIGSAYLANNQIPDLPIEEMGPTRTIARLRTRTQSEVGTLINNGDLNYLSTPLLREKYIRFLTVLRYLECASFNPLPRSARFDFIYECYSEAGSQSAYRSSRGSEGRRRFFSTENARRLDIILSHLRYWWRQSVLSYTDLACLLSSTLRAMEKVSNTQGTYHDFPRDRYDPRSLQPLKFDLPPFDYALSGGKHLVGCERDSLDFARECPDMDVLYLDPPYNFRQYTAYYFLANLVCRFPHMPDPHSYFSEIRYVRGQNPSDDFTSSFSKKSTFVTSLQRLIADAPARFVILSYFNGRNHWNEFKQTYSGPAPRPLCELFESSLFVPNSLETIPISRMNYQSYGGYSSSSVDEYLLIAERCGINSGRTHSDMDSQTYAMA